MTDPSRLLVVRLGSLGDLVHTLPSVAAIRRRHPSIEMDWLVDGVHAEFLSLVPVISSVVAMGGRGAGAWLDARRELQLRKYDLALDFQGLIKSAALARMSGAARVLGFDKASLRESSAAFFYSDTVDVGEDAHVVHKNLRLAAAVGADPSPLEFPIRDVESLATDHVVAQVAAPFAVINPGAAWPNKRWPPESFGRVAAHLKARHGLHAVVLWGPGEIELARAVAQAAGESAIVAPETHLTDLVALARRAKLFISGDTGPTHIAAAVGTPVVSLFGPTNPLRNGPWDPADISLSKYESCECHYERTCRRTTGWCLGEVTAGSVIEAVDRRLGL